MTEPKRLGRYELLEQLGEGGMGAVWLARLSGTGGFEKLCIVKTVLPSIAKDADFVSRFLHEGRVLTQLAHSNIAQVLDMNEEDGQLFLALEYVAGVDLSRLHEQLRASGEAMPVPLAVALAAQAAEGLGAAHRRTALDGTPLNIVHRDVSPHNLMVSFEGEVKVIDFGIARSEARSKHTAQPTVMGKLGYMAPEQASGEALDHRADQYALAIVLWELLANQPMIKRGTLTEMVVAMANPVLRPLGPLRAEVPASLEAVVMKALSRQPEARFESTDAFGAALHTELLELGPPPSKAQLGEYVRTRCAQAYTAERQLLTRVSTVRGLNTPTDPLGATAIRGATELSTPAASQPMTVPSRPAVRPSPAPVMLNAAKEVPAMKSEPPLSTSELRAATPKRSPVVLVLGVVAVAAIGAALFFALRPGPEPVAAAVDAGVAAPVGAGAPAIAVLLDAGAPAFDAGVLHWAPTAALATLKASGRASPTGYVVSNLSKVEWTDCTLLAPGQKVAAVGSMTPRASVVVPTASFVVVSDAPVLAGNQLQVTCTQGTGLFKPL